MVNKSWSSSAFNQLMNPGECSASSWSPPAQVIGLGGDGTSRNGPFICKIGVMGRHICRNVPRLTRLLHSLSLVAVGLSVVWDVVFNWLASPFCDWLVWIYVGIASAVMDCGLKWLVEIGRNFHCFSETTDQPHQRYLQANACCYGCAKETVKESKDLYMETQRRWPIFCKECFNALAWEQTWVFWLKFHWSLFPGVLLLVSQHVFR